MVFLYDGLSATASAWHKRHPIRTSPSYPRLSGVESSPDLHGGSSQWSTTQSAYGAGQSSIGVTRNKRDLVAAHLYVKEAGKDSHSVSNLESASERLTLHDQSRAEDAMKHLLESPQHKEVPLILGPTSPSGLGLQGPTGRFPLHPGASRGIAGGAQRLWSFERNPALLPDPLSRDRGRLGRSCSGVPPSTVPAPQSSSPENTSAFLHPHGHMSTSVSHQRSSSTPCREKLPRRNCKGLHGMIGMTWDGAAATAGGCYRGGSGKYLGF